MKKFVTLIILAAPLFMLRISAQQLPLFSEMYFMRLLYNPALTAYNGSTNLYGFYRNQWTDIPGHPITAGAEGEVSLWKDQIGTGFHVYSDNTDLIHNTSAQLYYAQKIRLAKDHLLSLGVSFGIMQTYIDYNNAVATDANDPNILAAGKGGVGFDMNVGLAYQWKKKLCINFSVPQVVNTNVDISTQVNNSLYALKRNFTAGASYEFSIDSEKFHIEPSVLFKSDFVSPQQYQLDADVMANYKRMVYLGFGYRLDYGFSIMAAVRIAKCVTLGYDFDVPYSANVTFAQTKGSHEVILGINFDKWVKRKQPKLDEFVKKSMFDSLMDAKQKDIDSLKHNVDSLRHDVDTATKTIDTLKHTLDSLNQNMNVYKQKADSFQNYQNINAQNQQGAQNPNQENQSNQTGQGVQSAENQQLQQQMIEQQEQMREMKARIDSFETLLKEYKKTVANKPIRNFPETVDKNTTAVSGDVFRLNSVNFDKNSSYLTRGSYLELDKVALFLQNNPNMYIRINGHTDYIASDEYNQWLSDRRAKRVFDYLVDKGIPAEHMMWIGFGKRAPIADNSTEEGRAKNRRVEVEVVKGKDGK
jgi:type IX secretion system PorP/SprF family membrane protein